MYLRTLGGVRLEGADFTRPKPLLLLTYLVVEGPQVRRRVADLFWAGGADPMKSLGVALARIRKGAPGTVDADDERAWATVRSDVADLIDAYEQGDPERVVATYSGPFLEGVALRHAGPELEEWVFETREFLAGRVRRTLIDLAEDSATAGELARAADAAERAWSVTDAIPEPEEMVRIHTLLLADDHPRATVVRKAVEPFGAELCATRKEAQRRLTHGSGGRSRKEPSRLPARATSFVGRRDELARIVERLTESDARLVTIKGPAGVGKSRVALEAARRLEQEARFPAGVAWVELEPLTSHRRIPDAIVEVLGIEGSRGDPLADVIAGIGDEEMLLVLDGFEHVLVGAGFVSDMLCACPGLRVLVASRALLNLEEEHVVELGGLPYPLEAVEEPGDALEYDAIRLFTMRARQAEAGFELKQENVRDVVGTCRAVDGLPLGIELAASWSRVLSIDEIAARMDRDPAFFVSRHRNVPDRHRSLRHAFEGSWELLDEAERAGLRQASVFRGGFRRGAAAAVAGLTIPVLASLVERSLLRVDRTGRYDRHPLVFQFTREKAAEHPSELAGARERHGRWCMEFLQRWEDDLVASDAKDAVRAIEEDLENVRAAWRWAAEEGKSAELGMGCRPLQVFYIQRGGLAEEAADEFRRAAARLDPADHRHDAERGRLLAAEAWFRFRRNDLDRGRAAAQEALRRLEPIADGRRDAHGTDETAVLRAIASARNTLGTIARSRGNADGARREFRAAMAVAQRMGNDRQVALLLNNLGLLLKDLGNYAEAERHYREAIDLNRRLGNQRSVVRNLVNLSTLLVHAGRVADADAAIQEGTALAEAVGYEQMVPHFVLNAGGAALARGDAKRARAELRKALDVAGDAARPSFRADALQLLGRCATALGEPEAARCAFHEALELADPDADRWTVAEALAGLAEHVLATGEPRTAVRILALAPNGAEAPRSVGDRLASVWHTLGQRVPKDDVQNARQAVAGVGRADAVEAALELSAPGN